VVFGRKIAMEWPYWEVLPGSFTRIKQRAQRVATSKIEVSSSVSLTFHISISQIFTHLPVLKQPIPRHVLSEWKHNPLPIGMGPGDMEVDGEVDQQTHGPNKERPKPKKGLNVMRLPPHLLTVKKFIRNLGAPIFHH